MAHIEKRGPSRYRARYRGPDGRERSKTFTKKIDADRFAAQVEVDRTRGTWIDPSLGRITFHEWCGSWLRTVGDLRATTVERQVGIVTNYLLPRFGRFPLAKVTPLEVRAFIAELQEADELSAASVRKIGQVLSRVMAGAVDAGLIFRSPCERLRLPAEESRELVFLDARQVADLASTIAPHYGRMVYAAAYTGLRWGELAGLRVANINPLQRKINVTEQLTEVGGDLRWGPPKTAAGRRSITLPRFLTSMLEEQIASAPVVQSGLLFPSPNGEPLRRSNFRRRVWMPAVRAVGCEALRFHDLRHTAVALAIAQGAHPKSIQERMGHSSITVTLDRYGHLFPALDERIADGLDETYTLASAT